MAKTQTAPTAADFEKQPAGPAVGTKAWRELKLRVLKRDADLIALDREDLDKDAEELRANGASDLEIQAALGAPARPAVFELASVNGLAYHVTEAELDAAKASLESAGYATRSQRITLPGNAKAFADLLQDLADRCAKAAKATKAVKR